jgi:hypothetical protein
MSVPAFPDATAQEKFMLMLLERVDGLADELHTVKEEQVETRVQLADTRAKLEDALAQLASPEWNLRIDNGGLHSSRWFMNVLSVEPLAADVFARRIMGVVRCGYVVAVSQGATMIGAHLTEAYINAESYLNLNATINAIKASVFSDHTRVDGKWSMHVVRLERNADALCTEYDMVQQQMADSGIDHGTLCKFSPTGSLEEYAFRPDEPSSAIREQRREFPLRMV